MGAVSTQKGGWGGAARGGQGATAPLWGHSHHKAGYDSQLLLPVPPTPPRYLDNICLHPEEEKYRKIKLQNKVFQVRLPPPVHAWPQRGWRQLGGPPAASWRWAAGGSRGARAL